MEYKKCEHCGEKIHIRSQKCPFCNQTVSEEPKEIIKDDAETTVNVANTQSEEEKNVIVENNIDTNDINNEEPRINFEIGSNGEPKDYIYKAEVRHSLEYTNPMSNIAKVFISALCTFPILGQLIGVFLGVFFSTYEDTDKRTFGKALIYLSIFMFVVYLAYVKYVMALLQSVDINELLNG